MRVRNIGAIPGVCSRWGSIRRFAATGFRISLGRFTTAQDIARAIAALSKLAPLAQLDQIA